MVTQSSIRAGIWGATGYTGHELIRVLLRHRGVDVVFLAAKIDNDTPIARVFPDLGGRTDLVCHGGGRPPEIDVAFLALPHTVSMKFAPDLLASGAKVVDLSADYRFKDRAEYAKWYKTAHQDPEGLRGAVYGLPEIYRDGIKQASLVANPGCYPTAAILAVAPLKGQGVRNVIIDAKTGVSGGGRNPSLAFHFPECNESVKAYKVGVHQHEPEIGRILSEVFGREVDLLFVPHVVGMDRGILSTCYIQMEKPLSVDDLYALYADRYRAEQFVRVRKDLPATKDSFGTNFCDIGIRARGNTAVVISCLDNLLKGAAGQAVQNMNIMFGLPEETGL